MENRHHVTYRRNSRRGQARENEKDRIADTKSEPEKKRLKTARRTMLFKGKNAGVNTLKMKHAHNERMKQNKRKKKDVSIENTCYARERKDTKSSRNKIHLYINRKETITDTDRQVSWKSADTE